MKTIRVVVGSMTMAMVLTGHTVGHATPNPTETVSSTIATVMNILNDPLFQQPGKSEERRAAIEEVVRNSVSYQDMARHSLGIAWWGLSEPEQLHFIDLFVQVLRDAVACRVNDYSETQVVFLSEQRDGNLAEVRTLFKGNKADTVINVRLVNRSGQWLMYDAVIDDVRVVENYRAQFDQVMRDVSYVGLIDRLEARTLVRKNFERTLTR